MALSSGQRRHLISAYATVHHLLRQMEEAATQGRSPTGVGPPLTPLPLEEVDAICGPLRELLTTLHERAEELAPRELAAFQRPQSAHNTRIWLSNLLEKIRAAVDGLQASQMRKYGRATEETDRAMNELHAQLDSKVQEARGALDDSV